jgi:protocatechuate 3,4-dioxygenase, beta subunit
LIFIDPKGFPSFNSKTEAMKISAIFLLPILLSVSACSQNKAAKDRMVGGQCEACELMYVGIPAKMSWETTLLSGGEPGEPIVISGVIFERDGRTPAKDIILYVYHTDNAGLYSPGVSKESSTRHGHLRGWMKTDAQGRYQFRSIRPASYPNRTAPQHIHPIVKEPNLSLYWIDEYMFDDDPLLTKEEANKPKNHGGSGIIHLTKNDKGEWIGKRDIILGLNIPGY